MGVLVPPVESKEWGGGIPRPAWQEGGFGGLDVPLGTQGGWGGLTMLVPSLRSEGGGVDP